MKARKRKNRLWRLWLKSMVHNNPPTNSWSIHGRRLRARKATHKKILKIASRKGYIIIGFERLVYE